MTAPAQVPSLFDWAGGSAAFEKLTTLLYDRVPADPVLGPIFANMSPDHPRHVAQFLIEVFGGPRDYSRLGGHARMIQHHLGRHLSEAHRRRWFELVLDCADEIGMPGDPEFRSAFVAYLEWGSRIAVITSQTTDPPDQTAPMPQWGWGVPERPFLG